MHIEGSVAFITGGASGLGLATGLALADAGARIFLVDLPPSLPEDLAGLAPGAKYFSADVTDEAQISSALDEAQLLGDVRIVVNCAGIAPGLKVLGKGGVHPLSDFRRALEVNLIGTFNVVRLAAERMSLAAAIDGERGVVVNTASVAAFEGQVGQAAYSASKGGVSAMTLPLARELAAHQIRVVAIAPGLFDTPMVSRLPTDVRESLGKQAPHPNRLGRPSEFGLLVAQIVANPMINGTTIRLDAGIRMSAK